MQRLSAKPAKKQWILLLAQACRGYSCHSFLPGPSICEAILRFTEGKAASYNLITIVVAESWKSVVMVILQGSQQGVIPAFGSV